MEQETVYYQHLAELMRRLIACYVNTAVELDVDGSIKQIKGVSLFRHDLKQLQHTGFSPKQEREYEQSLAVIRREYILMHRRAMRKGGAPVLLERLFSIFSASDFARHCVLLSFMSEIDGDFARILVHLQDDYQLTFPSMEFCLRTFTLNQQEQKKLLMEIQWEDKLYGALFDGWREGKTSYIGRTMKLKRRIVQLAFDWDSENPELMGFVRLYSKDDRTLPPLLAQTEIPERMARFDQGKRRILFSFSGPKGAGKKLQVRHFCKVCQKNLILVDLSKMPEQEEDFQKALADVALEAAVRQAYVAFEGVSALKESSGKERTLFASFERQMESFWKVSRVLFFLGEKEWHPIGEKEYGFLPISLAALSVEERSRMWESYLDILPTGSDVDIRLLAGKFPFTGGAIRASVMAALEQMQWQGKTQLDSDLIHEACRRQITHHLGQQATRIQSTYCWDDLVLPTRQKTLLQDACNQILFGYKVYEIWKFGGKVAYGRGVSMLFTGPPGTGKTMAAQVMANTLRMELFKVDLSGVMSKYVGETEKNLGAIFDEMKKSKNILFFDEADALFGKRSEVKDAQDRYANAQIAYLLQKMEEYDGIIILATNLMQNFDEAFKRRLKFVIDFPFPDEAQRRMLWEKVFPNEIPLDLDFDYLAHRFALSGSNIKNVAVAAAFLAAAQGEEASISMTHLLTAVQREYEKMGKTLTAGELGEYAGYLEFRK